MILACTGHRPARVRVGSLNAYHPSVHTRLTDLARAALRREAPARVVTGMAQGWDRAVAEAALELGIPFAAYVPFAGQETRWPRRARRRYEELLARAARVVIVCPGGYSREAMLRRNERRVDESDRLLALWDGGAGGTRDCVAYAASLGRPCRNLWRQWARHAGGREPRVADAVLSGLLEAAAVP